MAKETLSTSYKNDIMNSSMGGKRRFKLIDNGDGTVSLEDATTYDQKGTDFTATDLNKITKAVNASADAGKIIDDKDSILATTKAGYPAGALGVKNIIEELNSNLGNLKLIHAGNNYPSYATITGELTVSDDSPVTLQQTPQTITLKKGKKYLVVIIGVTGHLSMSDTSLITHQIDLKTTMPGDTWMYNSLYLIEPTSDTDITINSFWGVSLIFEI